MGNANVGAGAVVRVRAGLVDEVRTDRLDTEDLDALVLHPVDALSRNAAKAVQEGGRAGRLVVVVGAEEEDVTVADLLAAGGDCGLHLRDRYLMASRILAHVDADGVATERVERHLVDLGCLRVGIEVAKRVHVGGGVIRRDDDLRIERLLVARRIAVLQMPKHLHGGEEWVELRVLRQRLGEVDYAAGHGATPSGGASGCGRGRQDDRDRARGRRTRH